MSFTTTMGRGRLVARAFACGVALALPSCAIPDLRPPEPAQHPPETFPAGLTGADGTESSARIDVHDFFKDQTLLGLIDQALANNLELKIRAEDIQIASNEILARRGAYLPFVRFNGRAGFEKVSRFTRDGAVEEFLPIPPGREFPEPLPDYLIAANLSWQLDIWRELRNARDAASLRFLATAEGRNYVVTRVVADVAENYFGLLALDKRLETLDQTIQLQEQSLKIAIAKKEAGRGTELAVQRFQAEVRKNQSEKLIVGQEIVEVENRINTLMNRFPQPVERPKSEFFDLNLRALSVGLPSELLLNRPDIRQAELELAASGLDVLVARARFFPRLDLSAGVGYQAFNPRYLFNPEAIVYNLAGELVGPLINKSAIRADYLSANARQLQAVYDYQRVVLNAFTEVVNRVAMAENYRRSIELKKQQLQALEASVEAAGKLFQAARVEYSEVLFAQRDLLDARTDLINAKRQQLAAVVNAYQALGGGGVAIDGHQQSPHARH